MASPANTGAPQRGDIVLVPFPFTDLSSQKVRPAVIVSANPQNDDLVVTFISSVIPTCLRATEWLLAADHAEFPATGLKRPSVFKVAKLLTLHRSLIVRRLGRVGPFIQSELDLRLLKAFGLAKPR